MKKRLRTRHKIYLGVKIRLESGAFKVYQFGFRTMLKATSFIEKLKANGLLTNP